MRPQVERDWLYARSQAASEAFYRCLRKRYEVHIEATSADGFTDAHLPIK